MKKASLLLTALLTVTCAVYGQNESSVLRKITDADPATGARVVINNNSGVTPVRSNTDLKIKGYRIRIFFDNDQNARSQSYSVQSVFKSKYPSIPAYLTYESPYFKVTVGNCLTKEEATLLWGRLLADFPRAFIVSEDIPLSVFEEMPETLTIPADSTTHE